MPDSMTMARERKADARAGASPRVLGHMALHTRLGENGLAAELFEAVGCAVTEAVPGRDPDRRQFHVIKVNAADPDGRDDIIYLSTMADEQAALEDALKQLLQSGLAADFPAFQQQKIREPEHFFHFGIHYDSLEDLERAALALKAAVDAQTPMGKRIQRLQILKAPAGHDAATDARMAASPLFGTVEEEAYYPGEVQVHVNTDLFGSGVNLFGSVLELDYRFPGIEGGPQERAVLAA